MKKFLTLIVGLTALFSVGCDPMEDVYDDLNIQEEGVQGNVDYTLVEDDYKETLKLNYANFNSTEDAKTLIPEVLDVQYPALGKNSLAFVTYDLYASRPTEDSLVTYTVTTADYDSNEETAKYDNFDDEAQIYTFLPA